MLSKIPEQAAVKQSEKKELQRIFKNQVHFAPEILLTHSYDATQQSFLPEAVLFVENEEDIYQITRFASQHKIPLVPRGAGVGYSGGAVPVKGGIVLSFSRFNRILNIDRKNFQAEVEPGVITGILQNEVEKFNLFYPPDPASAMNSTIGGNVAENAGGPRCFKYGVTADYVMALEAFLINGSKIHCGSKAIKDVAGYNLKSLLVGSEGTLAIFSRIILKLIPLPEKRALYELNFNSLQQAVDFVLTVIYERIQPSALEFLDETALSVSYAFLNRTKPAEHQAQVLLEIDGTAEEITHRARRIEKIINQSKINFQKAEEKESIEQLWTIRRSISPAISRLKPLKINEDIAVPIAAIPETVNYIKNICRQENITVVLFGHIGDGNIHTNLLIDPAKKDEADRATKILAEIFGMVCANQGSISGEHGIGIAKKNFLKYQYSPHEIELFKKIKQVFDPENLLNPDKIF